MEISFFFSKELYCCEFFLPLISLLFREFRSICYQLFKNVTNYCKLFIVIFMHTVEKKGAGCSFIFRIYHEQLIEKGPLEDRYYNLNRFVLLRMHGAFMGSRFEVLLTSQDCSLTGYPLMFCFFIK